MTYESLRAAFENGLKPWPQGPMVMHPEHIEVLEHFGIVKEGRIDLAALNAYRQEHGI